MMGQKRGRKGQSKDSQPNEILMSNQFDALSDDETDPSSIENNGKHAKILNKERVPPIVVTVSEFASFRKEILTFVKHFKYTFQIGQRGDCRVLAETIAGFNCLREYLTLKAYKFFTYDTRAERLFKVVLKGLPGGESLDEIKIELNKLLGVQPVQVIKLKMRSRPSVLRRGISNEFFLVHFKSSELNNLKALEKASLMLHVRVKWEHYRKNSKFAQGLTQCRKCQGFGHGTKHCNMDAKCMLCGNSSHGKDECPVKEDSNKFKCANCGENHKANYWECKTRKAILHSRNRRQVGHAHRVQFTTNSSVANNSQQNNTSVPVVNNSTVGTQMSNVQIRINNNQRSNHSVLPAANTAQQRNRPSYAATVAGNGMGRQSEENVFDLGPITAPKLESLQASLIEMINAMIDTHSMREAIVVGVEFANRIVMQYKFNNGTN